MKYRLITKENLCLSLCKMFNESWFILSTHSMRLLESMCNLWTQTTERVEAGSCRSTVSDLFWVMHFNLPQLLHVCLDWDQTQHEYFRLNIYNLFTPIICHQQTHGWLDLSSGFASSQSERKKRILRRLKRIVSRMLTSNLAVRAPCQLWQTFIIVLHQRQDVAFLWQPWMRTRCRHQCVLFESVCACLSHQVFVGKNLTSIPY